MSLQAHIEAIGLLGPGLNNWSAARAVLRGEQQYQAAATQAPAPPLLPPAERRRASMAIRVALAVGAEAVMANPEAAAQLPTVFATSGGDGDNCHVICETLALPAADRQLSPTRFHQSVHNAPSGYWSIAAQARAASTCIAAYDASFAAGLLEATVQLQLYDKVLLIAFDTAYPEPLHAKRPIPDAFACALLFSATASPQTIATLRVQTTSQAAHPCQPAALETMRAQIPAARALPLLQRLAQRMAGTVVLDYLAPLQLGVHLEFAKQ